MKFSLFKQTEAEVFKTPPISDKTITLTSLGRNKAEDMSVKAPFSDVLSGLLECGGTCTIKELSEQSGYPTSKVHNLCKSLERSNYIKCLP